MGVFLMAVVLFAAPAAPSAHVHGGDDANSPTPQHQNHPVDANVPAPRGTMVSLSVGGRPSQAYVAQPKGQPRGGVLVVHEWWGLNGWVKHKADELADAGYMALAVDLYEGTVATTPQQAGSLMEKLDHLRATQVETAGVAYLHAALKGKKLATLGWCMGGGESLNASLANTADVDGTVMYYGMPVSEVDKLKTLHGPLLGVFALKDGWITTDKVKAFDAALTKAGVKHELKEYDADHGFANPTGGKYNPPAAKDADAKTAAFLKDLFK